MQGAGGAGSCADALLPAGPRPVEEPMRACGAPPVGSTQRRTGGVGQHCRSAETQGPARTCGAGPGGSTCAAGWRCCRGCPACALRRRRRRCAPPSRGSCWTPTRPCSRPRSSASRRALELIRCSSEASSVPKVQAGGMLSRASQRCPHAISTCGKGIACFLSSAISEAAHRPSASWERAQSRACGCWAWRTPGCNHAKVHRVEVELPSEGLAAALPGPYLRTADPCRGSLTLVGGP